jgi:hypothetical protein
MPQMIKCFQETRVTIHTFRFQLIDSHTPYELCGNKVIFGIQ